MTMKAIRMIFAAMFTRFFGLSEWKMQGPRYRPAGPDHTCGWDILSCFIRTILSVATVITPTLLVLKMIGIFDGSWFMVFLPVLIEAGWHALQDIIDICVAKVRSRRERAFWVNEYRRERELEKTAYNPGEYVEDTADDME